MSRRNSDVGLVVGAAAVAVVAFLLIRKQQREAFADVQAPSGTPDNMPPGWGQT